MNNIKNPTADVSLSIIYGADDHLNGWDDHLNGWDDHLSGRDDHPNDRGDHPNGWGDHLDATVFVQKYLVQLPDEKTLKEYIAKEFYNR